MKFLVGSVLALLVASAPAAAQEELGKKEKKKINLQLEKYDGAKSYAIEYEKVIPLETVKKIGTELDEVLTQYMSVFRFKPSGKLKVMFLDSQNTYEQMGGKPSSAGHFMSHTEYLYLKQLPFYELISTAYHEAFHQYLHFYIGRGVDIPTWFNEGMAGYYEEMKRDKGTKKLDYKLIDNRKIRMVKEKVFTRTVMPVEQIIKAQYADFHDKSDSEVEANFYNHSFGLIYFFMKGMGGKPVFQFAEELKKTKDTNAALEKIFGKDLKKIKTIDAQWKAYLTQLKIQEKSS